MSEAQQGGSSKLEQMTSYYENYPEVLHSFKHLIRYRPAVLDGYLTLRQAAFNTEPDAALSPKYKELIIIAIECARTKTNPPPVGHARRAIDAGATMQEIAETVALCIPIAGMLSYQESGRYVLEAAEAYARERGMTADGEADPCPA